MSIFSKTPKPNPKITVGGIEIVFHQEYAGWAFIYRETVSSHTASSASY